MTSKDPFQPKAFYDSVTTSFPIILLFSIYKYFRVLWNLETKYGGEKVNGGGGMVISYTVFLPAKGEICTNRQLQLIEFHLTLRSTRCMLTRSEHFIWHCSLFFVSPSKILCKNETFPILYYFNREQGNMKQQLWKTKLVIIQAKNFSAYQLLWTINYSLQAIK